MNGEEYTEMICEEDDDYDNEWELDSVEGWTDYLFNGMDSYHSNTYQDRKFKWRHCKPSSPHSSIGEFIVGGSKSIKLDETDNCGKGGTKWRRTCQDINGGHSGIHRIEQTFCNKMEDRRWDIYCGLLDTSAHQLDQDSCEWYAADGGWLNWFNDAVDFECPDDGIMRGIESEFWESKDDRRFRIECCKLIDISYSFTDIIGEWQRIFSCDGCEHSESPNTYSIEWGTESSWTQSSSSSYTSSLTASVGVGLSFEYGGVGAETSIEISGTESETVSHSMEETFSSYSLESATLTCNKIYFYQWLVSGNEARSDGGVGIFTSYSKDYLCTNIEYPQCPFGFCEPDTDCQICKNADPKCENGIINPDISCGDYDDCATYCHPNTCTQFCGSGCRAGCCCSDYNYGKSGDRSCNQFEAPCKIMQ